MCIIVIFQCFFFSVPYNLFFTNTISSHTKLLKISKQNSMVTTYCVHVSVVIKVVLDIIGNDEVHMAL